MQEGYAQLFIRRSFKKSFSENTHRSPHTNIVHYLKKNNKWNAPRGEEDVVGGIHLTFETFSMVDSKINCLLRRLFGKSKIFVLRLTGSHLQNITSHYNIQTSSLSHFRTITGEKRKKYQPLKKSFVCTCAAYLLSIKQEYLKRCKIKWAVKGGDPERSFLFIFKKNQRLFLYTNHHIKCNETSYPVLTTNIKNDEDDDDSLRNDICMTATQL